MAYIKQVFAVCAGVFIFAAGASLVSCGGSANVTNAPPPPVIGAVTTWHNDIARTGQNLNETILTAANVNSSTFGLLFTIPTDGPVHAQPLYVPNITIPGKGTHNVLFVATENASVYGVDADTGKQLWQVSLLGANESLGESPACLGLIGITATPVIDTNTGPHGTIYVVAMSKDANGNQHQRLHALDLTSGAEEFGGPKEVQARYPGTGDNSSGGYVIFNPAQQFERAGLLLLNGVVYTGWGSFCDIRPYTGWLIGYDAKTLEQVTVLNFAPNGSGGSLWNAGAAPAADAMGNIYALDANGAFDTTLNNQGFPSLGDFGNAFLKISTGPAPGLCPPLSIKLGNPACPNGTSNKQLAVADYFEMMHQDSENALDQDLGSGGAVLLPDLVDRTGKKRHLAVGAGKDGVIYVVDRDSMGKFNPNSNNVYQELDGVLGASVFSTPAFFDNTLYYGPIKSTIKAFPISNAQVSSIPTSQTPTPFTYPGATPSISANGTSNAILWASENFAPAILRAYDATNLAHELYNSNQAGGRDQFGTGGGNMFVTVINGKVYVGSLTGVGVFGLRQQ